jgi:hypothetical protein
LTVCPLVTALCVIVSVVFSDVPGGAVGANLTDAVHAVRAASGEGHPVTV